MNVSLRIIAGFVITMLLVYGCRHKTISPQTPQTKITLAYSATFHTALVAIAFKKGCFSEEGLDMTLKSFPFGKGAFDTMLDGKADIATVAQTPFVFAVVEGVKPLILASIETARGDEAIIARKDKGISRPSELKGKKIGVPLKTIGDSYLEAFLRANGLRRKDVNVIGMRPEIIAEALFKGNVDAVSIWNPLAIQIQKELGPEAVSFYDRDIFTETFTIASTRNYVRNNPEVIRKVLKALLKAEEFVKNNPAESQQLVSEFLGADKSQLTQVWDIFNYAVTLDESLLVNLEQETRWVIDTDATGTKKMPNYLDYIYTAGLTAVRPEAVRLIK